MFDEGGEAESEPRPSPLGYGYPAALRAYVTLHLIHPTGNTPNSNIHIQNPGTSHRRSA